MWERYSTRSRVWWLCPTRMCAPKKTINADFNVTRFKNDRFLWETSVFGTYLFDAITLKPYTLNGNTEIEYDGELSEIYANHNSRRAYVVGSTTRLKARFLKMFMADASLTYTYGDIIDGRMNVCPRPYISAFRKGGHDLSEQRRQGHCGVYSLFNGRKKLDRYNLNGEDNIGYATVKGEEGRGLPAWFTLNLKASYAFNPNLTVQAGIDNLLDTEYRTFGSGINAMGRNINVTLRTTF